MKAIKLFAICACLSWGMTSCSDFLEEDNRSNINSDKYFMEASGYESLVTAGYSTLRSIWKNEPWLFCLGVDIYTRGESELISGSYGSRDVYSSELNEYGALDAQNSYVSSFYSNVYYGIQVCNTAIARAASAAISDNLKAQRAAEMRFLRAYYHFLLVEQFGEIAIVTDEIQSPVLDFPKNSEQDVYKFILSELGEIEGVLPASQSDYGRITKGAVKHLQSLVHLTRGYKPFADANDFSKAASLADELINGGQYQLEPTFESLFRPGNEKNKEIIFSIQYDAGSLSGPNSGNAQSFLFGFELWNKTPSGFVRGDLTYGWKKNQFMPTQFLYSLFDTSKDSRYDVTFKSEYYAVAADATIGLNVGDLRIYFPKYDEEFTAADEAALLAEHPNAIIVTKEQWKQDIEGVGGSGMCPMVWKFYDPEAAWGDNNTGYSNTRDIFMFRLGDTYLMAAEAYHKMNDNAKAADRINAIRRRAAIEGQESGMAVTAADIDIDFILDERARELVGEYKRWPDLKRTGKLIERTLQHNNLAAKMNKMDSHILLRPIPQSVIDQGKGNFAQNPGY